jgi:hypothetical protein
MSTFDVLVGVVIGALICVASIYGAGYRITKL